MHKIARKFAIFLKIPYNSGRNFPERQHIIWMNVATRRVCLSGEIVMTLRCGVSFILKNDAAMFDCFNQRTEATGRGWFIFDSRLGSLTLPLLKPGISQTLSLRCFVNAFTCSHSCFVCLLVFPVISKYRSFDVLCFVVCSCSYT